MVEIPLLWLDYSNRRFDIGNDKRIHGHLIILLAKQEPDGCSTTRGRHMPPRTPETDQVKTMPCRYLPALVAIDKSTCLGRAAPYELYCTIQPSTGLRIGISTVDVATSTTRQQTNTIDQNLWLPLNAGERDLRTGSSRSDRTDGEIPLLASTRRQIRWLEPNQYSAQIIKDIDASRLLNWRHPMLLVCLCVLPIWLGYLTSIRSNTVDG